MPWRTLQINVCIQSQFILQLGCDNSKKKSPLFPLRSGLHEDGITAWAVLSSFRRDSEEGRGGG